MLDGETLAYAVGEINRYNVRKLVLAGPALKSTPLVGYSRTTEPENSGARGRGDDRYQGRGGG